MHGEDACNRKCRLSGNDNIAGKRFVEVIGLRKALTMRKYQSHPAIGPELTMDYNSQQLSLAAGDRHDIWEREFQEDLLLLVHKVDPGPVDGHDDVVLGEAGSCGGGDTGRNVRLSSQ